MKSNWIRLTESEKVKAKCVVTDRRTKYEFTNFVAVGFSEDEETTIVAAKLIDLRRAITTLLQVFYKSMKMASPEVRREVAGEKGWNGILRYLYNDEEDWDD